MVQAQGEQFGQDGHAKTMAEFIQAHIANSNGILNAHEKRPVNAPRPPYDPNHVDNQWPVMVHHPAKGELTVGKSVVGIASPAAKAQAVKDNEAELKDALANGYRKEPYAKPQVLALSPQEQLAAAMKREEELRGMIAQLADSHEKLKVSIAAKPVK